MSHHDDRGAYTPRDEPLAFDARGQRGGGGRAPTTLILSAAILLLLAAGVFFYYRSGVRREGEAPRVLGQPVGEMTSAPPASSQPSDAAADMGVYQTEQAPASEAAPTFAPAPEQVMPRPAPPAPAPVLRPAPAPVAAAPHPAPAAASAPPPATTVRPAPAPASVKPAAPVAKPAPAVTAAAVAASGDTRTAKTASAAGLRPEIGLPTRADKAAADKAAADKAAKAAKTAAAPAAAKPAAGATGPAVVQIGAFSNDDQAEKGWQGVARALPGDMAGKGKRVEVASVGGKTFHRTFVTGFASKASAQAFCKKLAAAGKSCIVR